VSAILVCTGALVLYPLLRYGVPLVPHLFGSEFERAFAALVLAALLLIGCFGCALIAIAVLLLQGSKVGRGLACVTSSVVAFSQLFEGQATSVGGAQHSAASIAILLCCIAIVLLVTLPLDVRAYFAHDAYRPVGVIATSVVLSYMGVVTIAFGVLLLPVSSLAGKYAAYGLLLIAVGVALIAANRPLHAGVAGARVFVSLVLVAYVVLLAAVEGGMQTPASLLALGLCVGCLAMLWLLPSSNAHFPARRYPITGS